MEGIGSGGARKNAGRKPIDGSARSKISLTLPTWQLSHYITGHRNPSPRTIEKIDKAFHAFANELSQVHFV